MNKFDWIKNFKIQDQDEWMQIKDFIPDIFDRFFYIHWTVGIIDDFPFDNYPENNNTIEETNSRIKIEREFNLFLTKDSEELFRPTSLKELSQKFNVLYSHLTYSKIKKTPGVEILDKLSVDRLKTSLTKISEGLVLNLFVEDIYRHPIDNNLKQDFENIKLTDYFDLQKTFFFDYCTYLFPDNLDWCLTTREDAPMILAYKNDLVDSLKEKFELELFELSYKQNIYD